METLDSTRPFTRREALRAGVTDGRLRGPGYRQLFRGVYADSSVVVTPKVRARAALLLHPDGAVIGGLTAAGLLDLPVPGHDQTQVFVASAGDRRPRPGLRSSTGAIGAVLGEVDGVRTMRRCRCWRGPDDRDNSAACAVAVRHPTSAYGIRA